MSRPSATTENLTPEVFAILAKFINRRPGLNPRDYYDPNDYTSGRKAVYHQGRQTFIQENRRISRDGTTARKLLKQAQEYPFDASAMLEASRAFAGRLQFIMQGSKLGIEYCAGQYFPTEYRPAASAVLESYIHAVKPRELPKPTDSFFTVEDLASANDRKGGHWFSPGTKRFFSSRILPTLYKGQHLIWFVSSEKSGFSDSSARKFTVRVFDTRTADVNTAGEHLGHSDATSAKSAAREYARLDLAGEHRKPLDDRTKCELCGHYGTGCTGTAVVNG